eukprot:CAMPEP_0116935790 /NCGR_PEP_ID=MMETSP0467-20121206/30495_1 /TAXON_ID=283647 /ORGANISM="Mesodinium pulex, Strain SPMC105" /LENGTH=216 /DNA_ID=CAMNT_0004617235 /DNA_START=1198 /DNA_END=1848 /DNA_ORIENTATION=+
MALWEYPEGLQKHFIMKRADMDDGKNISMFFNTDDIKTFVIGNMTLQLKEKLEQDKMKSMLTDRNEFEQLVDRYMIEFGYKFNSDDIDKRLEDKMKKNSIYNKNEKTGEAKKTDDTKKDENDENDASVATGSDSDSNSDVQGKSEGAGEAQGEDFLNPEEKEEKESKASEADALNKQTDSTDASTDAVEGSEEKENKDTKIKEVKVREKPRNLIQE